MWHTSTACSDLNRDSHAYRYAQHAKAGDVLGAVVLPELPSFSLAQQHKDMARAPSLPNPLEKHSRRCVRCSAGCWLQAGVLQTAAWAWALPLRQPQAAPLSPGLWTHPQAQQGHPAAGSTQPHHPVCVKGGGAKKGGGGGVSTDVQHAQRHLRWMFIQVDEHLAHEVRFGAQQTTLKVLRQHLSCCWCCWWRAALTTFAICFSMAAVLRLAVWLPSFLAFATAYAARPGCALLAAISMACCGLKGEPPERGVKLTWGGGV